MLRWCMYCQQFQGEVAPFSNFNTTHITCPSCKAKRRAQLDSEIQRSWMLRGLQEQLMEIGKSGDSLAAEECVDLAIRANVRPVDILVGLIAPLLYIIGEQWSLKTITVVDEHH